MDTLIKNVKNKEMNDNDVVTFMNLIEDNQTKAVQLLLENGVNPNLTNRAGDTAILYAIAADNPEMVELLIKFGANLEAKIKEGCTLLILTSSNDCIKIAELLLKNGANTEETDDNNITALMHAAESGYTKMVELLMRYGAKIEAIGLDGKTALIFAASCGQVGIVKMLIQCNANVQKASNIRKKTVTMYAARAGKTEVVDVLIQAGANIGARDSDDLTALDHAANNKHISTAYRLLCSYSLKERGEFALDGRENLNLVDDFDKELYKYQEKIYLIIRTPYKLKVNPENECHFSFFPLEIINFIKLLEAKLQCFPEWYQHRVESDINLAFALKAQALMTPAYDAKKNKSAQDIEVELNNLQASVLNLRLN